MESFLREGVDLRDISRKAIGSDGHFFEDHDSPLKLRSYLESSNVCIIKANSTHI
jgi:hypothetical protein